MCPYAISKSTRNGGQKTMTKTPKWMKKLTAGERKHLREDAFNPGDNPTLAGVRRNRAGQIKFGIRCFDCESIARKLGME